MKKNTFVLGMAGLCAGLVIGLVVSMYVAGGKSSDGGSGSEPQPLYWVAPMDPNYRRSEPGKSPMGMDLVPVYEETDSATADEAGVVEISSAVVNNLGVKTAQAAYSELDDQIRAVGLVQYDEDRLIHIHPRVEGWVDTLYVKTSGAPVKKGQPLYTLYSPNLINAQEELLLALRSSNDRLIQSAKERLRSLNLTEESVSTLMKTREAKQNVTFYAPQSGVVDNLNIREGFFVQPGTTMMSIGYLGQVWVEAEILEAQLGKIEPGQEVSMFLEAFPGQIWQGQVDYIYPSLDATTRAGRVRLRFDNPDRHLKPGMFATVVIHAKPSEQVLAVPNSALIRLKDQTRVVLALGGGRFKSVQVLTGRRDAERTEIRKGLDEGAMVVTSAQFLLDSESSKTADFSRMRLLEALPTATVAGIIKAMEPVARKVTISRDAIEKWGRPAATMDFSIAKGLDVSQWRAGQAIHFTFVIDDGDFIVTELQILSDEGHQKDASGPMPNSDQGALEHGGQHD